MPIAPRILRAFERDLTIDITTTGRKAGRPQHIEIWFMHIDGGTYTTGVVDSIERVWR